jgi:hypothetical protein
MTHIELTPVGGALGAESVETANIKKESVTTAKIALLAVTAQQIGAEAVTAPKIRNPPQPATPAGEGEVAVGESGGARKSISVCTGKAGETKYKIKHGLALNASAAIVQVFKMTTKVVTEPYLQAAGAGNYTYKILSATEVEVIFGTELKAGEEAAVVVIG